jgi:hypothetical protein
VDLRTRPPWKNNLNWLFGGRLAATKTGLEIWRKVAAPIEAPLMQATGGRVRLSFTTPVVLCELHTGSQGSRFVADESLGADRDRLYGLAVDRLAKVFSLHEQRSGTRTIPVMRLTPKP